MAKRLPKNTVSMSAWKKKHPEWIPTPMDINPAKKVTALADWLDAIECEACGYERTCKECRVRKLKASIGRINALMDTLTTVNK